MNKYSPNSKAQGFTLVEMMIVVAIIAILSMIAVPSYQRYIERGDLNNAYAELVKINQLVKTERIKDPASYHTTAEINAFISGLGIDQTVADKYAIQAQGSAAGSTSNRYELYAIPNASYQSRYTKGVWMDSIGNAYKCDDYNDAKNFSTSSCEKVGN